MGKQRPTREDAQKLDGILRNMQERQERELREAIAFKPGELTPEEEKFVKENNLNALNYIPQRTIQKQAEMLASPKRPTAPDIRQQLADRFDGFGYGLFLLFIVLFAWGIADAHGWPIGIFCGLLMFAVLELSYRLSTRP
jgi:hypothetical protein